MPLWVEPRPGGPGRPPADAGSRVSRRFSATKRMSIAATFFVFLHQIFCLVRNSWYSICFCCLLLDVVRICIHIRSFSWNLRWNADWILTMVQFVLRLEACTQTLSRIHCSCFRAVRGDDWSWRFSAQFDLSGTMSAARSQVGEWHVVGDVVFGSSMIFLEPLNMKSQWKRGQAVAHFGGRGGQVQVRQHSDN